MQAPNIDPQDFLTKFVAQFEEIDATELVMATKFRDLPEWSSMQSLIVIASFDWEYGVTVSAEELRAAHTVQDLYDVVLSKKSD